MNLPVFAPTIELHISRRLKEALPPLTAEEKKQLEDNIVADGRVFDSLRYWYDGQKNVVVDGMNRLEIARRRNIPYTTEELHFADYDEAILWIKLHALGRRNLTDQQRRRLIGEVYNATRQTQGGDRRSDQTATAAGCSAPGGTAARIAEEAGVSERTVRTAGKVVAALNGFPEAMRTAIESGKHPASDKMILALAKLTPGQIATLWGDVRTSRRPTWEAAMAARGHARPSRETAPAVPTNGRPAAEPQADTPSVWDNIAQGLWPKLRELRTSNAELLRLSELNMDDQRTVVGLINGTTYKTVASALSGWSGPAPERPDADPAVEQRRRHLGGMKASLDQMLVRVDEIAAEAGRPEPDYAQQALDGLNQARSALAKWARKL